MKIAVYSGSFNPLHIGHLAIIRYLMEQMEFDNVYLVVSPQNPLKETVDGDSAEKRFLAAQEAVKRRGLGIRVDDIELKMPRPSFTIDTLDKLKEREPENEFSLVIGADNLAGISRWKSYGRILKEYGVVVYPRTGYDIHGLADTLKKQGDFRIRIMDAPLIDISSTYIRQGISEGKDMDRFLM